MQTAGARAGEVLAGAPLDDGDVDPRQRQLGRQHQPRRTSSSDHHRMFGHAGASRRASLDHGSTDRGRPGRSLRSAAGARGRRGGRARSGGAGRRPSRSRGTIFIRSRSILTGSSACEAEPLGETANVGVDDDPLRVAELGSDDVRRLPRDARVAASSSSSVRGPCRRTPRPASSSSRAATFVFCRKKPVGRMSRSSSSTGTAR